MHLVIKALLRLLPSPLRQRVIKFCRNQGILFCRDLISLSVDTVQSWATPYIGQVTAKTLTHESWVEAPAQCLSGDTLPIFEPGWIRTEHVYLDIDNTGQKNRAFSLRNNHLIDERRNVIYEPDLTLEVMPISRQILEPAPRVRGTVAYLSNTDINNYYHWLAWILPQLKLYQQFVDLREIDYFYLGKGSLSPYKLETLARCGISSDRILQTGCTPDRILAAVAHRTGTQAGGMDQTTFAFSRSLFADVIEQRKTRPRRRLYVMRGAVQWRRLLNEAEVIEALMPYGFEPVSMDGKTVAEQAQLFAEAEAVVAVHGAALTNALFVQPGTKIIELFPYGYHFNVYYLLASYAQAKYYYLVGDRFTTQKTGNRLDIMVNPEKLKAICELATLTRTTRGALSR